MASMASPLGLSSSGQTSLSRCTGVQRWAEPGQEGLRLDWSFLMSKEKWGTNPGTILTLNHPEEARNLNSNLASWLLGKNHCTGKTETNTGYRFLLNSLLTWYITKIFRLQWLGFPFVLLPPHPPNTRSDCKKNTNDHCPSDFKLTHCVMVKKNLYLLTCIFSH
jgi:hypothetical protein